MSHNKTMYRATDNQTIPGRFLHLSGVSLTPDKNYSWIGTEAQFEALCIKHEWDGLNLVPVKIFS